MRYSTQPTLALLGLYFASATALALPDMPDESGWGGHVNLGAGVGSSESNMLAGISSIDLGQDKISSLEEDPGSEDLVLPMLQYEVHYTMADSRTQLYLGNHSADFISFDIETTLTTSAGVRQEIGESTVDFSLTASTLPVDVWKDPYLVDAKRGDTERTSKGIQVAWDRIFGSQFEFAWSSVEVEIDDEDSGTALDLSKADRRLLERTGQVNRVDLYYHWKINERHSLEPALGFLDQDLDGDAMAQDGPTLQLKHVYQRDRWRFVSRLFYRDLESDTRNPIYGERRTLETLGGVFTAFYAKPFGLKDWTANATVSYYEDDSSIDFYDASFGLVSLGMFYRFD